MLCKRKCSTAKTRFRLYKAAQAMTWDFLCLSLCVGVNTESHERCSHWDDICSGAPTERCYQLGNPDPDSCLEVKINSDDRLNIILLLSQVQSTFVHLSPSHFSSSFLLFSPSVCFWLFSTSYFTLMHSFFKKGRQNRSYLCFCLSLCFSFSYFLSLVA